MRYCKLNIISVIFLTFSIYKSHMMWWLWINGMNIILVDELVDAPYVIFSPKHICIYLIEHMHKCSLIINVFNSNQLVCGWWNMNFRIPERWGCVVVLKVGKLQRTQGKLTYRRYTQHEFKLIHIQCSFKSPRQ